MKRTVERVAEDTLLNVSDLSFRYSRSTPLVLDQLSFSCKPGSLVVIEGQNGSGKSTMLKICAGELRPTSGSVTHVKETAYLPQGVESLNPRLTTSEHVALFATAYGMKSGEGTARARSILDRLSVPGSIDLNVQLGTLSGGTQQKVNLTLALMNQSARLLLLDEPYSGFDSASLVAMLTIFTELLDEGKCVVMVNHLTDLRIKPDQVIDLTIAAGE